jgi:hypothetical protein
VVREEGEKTRVLTRNSLERSEGAEEAGRRRHRRLLASGRQARGGRLEASRLSWLVEEEEGVAAELLGYTERLREATNSRAPRRPELGFGRAQGEEERAREEGEGRVREQRRGILILVQRAAASILADDGEAAHRVASAAPPCCFFSGTKTTNR